jgi:tellurite resistance protein TerC
VPRARRPPLRGGLERGRSRRSARFIVFTSNIFAILGVRSLFFLLAGLVEKFVYLKVGLSAVLVFVGAKMTLIDFVKIPAPVSLAVVLGLLGGAMLASWWVARRRAAALPSAG